MPTPADFSATLSTAVGTVLGASSLTNARMSSDFDVLHEPVPEGEARFQIQSFTLPQSLNPDSESNYRPGVACLVRVHYKITHPDEIDYTQGAMQAVLQTLCTAAWWRALSGVHYLDVPPVGGDVARVGDVVSFTVTATVTIDPP